MRVCLRMIESECSSMICVLYIIYRPKQNKIKKLNRNQMHQRVLRANFYLSK